MIKAFTNQISTATPPHDVHDKFVSYAPRLLGDDRAQKLFHKMAQRADIEHRYSFLEPNGSDGKLDTGGFYQTDQFPDTAARMAFYKAHAFGLACQAIDPLNINETITHIITTTCTGFYAPGIDLQIIDHYGLKGSTERTAIGFMGCYAAMNALKLARHIVRSDENARVLIVNLELCTLHLQKPITLEELLSFMIFADGCAASIVSADETGLELESFKTTLIPDTQNQITWDIGGMGFDMILSGKVPQIIASSLPDALPDIFNGGDKENISHWAIHPGGRTILDAVEKGAALAPDALNVSRDILRNYGNMSSATVMFVLEAMMRKNVNQGCAMAFGPGVAVESMMFKSAEQ